MEFIFWKKTENLNSDFSSKEKIIKYIQNKKRAYTWKPNRIPNFPRTVVTWSLKEVSKNKTRVTLIHSGFTGDSVEMLKEHSTGWIILLQD